MIRPMTVDLPCGRSLSNDGLAWSWVGTLTFYVDNGPAVVAGIIGAGSGVAVTLGALAVFMWWRWRKLRKVASPTGG